MKKYGLLCLVLLPVMLFAQAQSLQTENLHEQSSKGFYSIDIQYPQLGTTKSTDPLNQPQQHFNQMMQSWVVQQKQSFIAQVRETMQRWQARQAADAVNGEQPFAAKPDVHSNQLKIQFTLEPNNVGVLSVRFLSTQALFLAAHPSSQVVTFNIDKATGNKLSLRDIISSNADILNILSNYSREKLRPLLQQKMPQAWDKQAEQWLLKGTAPKTDNFQRWNITEQGILLTFEPYQIAAYSYGRFAVMVPWSSLPNPRKIK